MDNGQPATTDSDDTAPVRPRVMVVDDQADARELVRRMLAKECDIVEADSGEDAWEKLQHDDGVVMMITDLRMPGLDGCDLIGRIRASEVARVRDMPVLLITGSDGNEARQRAFVRGATGFIVKPIDINQLRALVGMYLRRISASQELNAKPATAAKQSSFVDPLTHLRSARYFIERGTRDFAFSTRLKSDLAVVCIEIDGFKDIVKDHGQPLADQMLVWLSELLLKHTPAEDTVARFADAQFGVLAMATDMQKATLLVDTLHRAMLEHPFMKNKSGVPVSLRVGIATLKQDQAKSLDALVKLARERLDAPQRRENIEVVPYVTDVAPAVAVPPPDAAVLPETPDAPAETNADETHSVEFVASTTVESPSMSVEVPDAVPSAPEPLPSMLAEIGEAVELPLTSTPTPPVIAPVLDAPPVPFELMSVDTAVMLMAHHREALLLPYADYLLQQIQPLLDYHEKYGDHKKLNAR